MILQFLPSRVRQETVVQAGFFVLKVALFLPFSLFAQVPNAAWTTILSVSAGCSFLQAPVGQQHAGLLANANDQPDRN